MRKITLPRILLLNLLVALIGLLAWRIPFSSLLSKYYFNQALADILVNGPVSPVTTDYLSQALTLDPNNYVAHYWLGTIYYQGKEYANAAEQFDAYLKISPLNAGAYYYLGESYFELGQFDPASQAYLEAMRLDPRNATYLETTLERYKTMGKDFEYFQSLYRLASLTSDAGERLKYSLEMAKVLERSPQLIPIRAGAPLGFGRQTSAASNVDGKLFLLACSDNYPNLIILSASDDEGKTWTVIKALYVISDKNAPEGTLMIDQGGTIHLFYGASKGQSIYVNSGSNFDAPVFIPQVGDSRQLGVDSDGVVHLVWADGESTIFHSEINSSGLLGEVETVATGAFPSLAIDGKNLIVTYNLGVNFPNQRGGVFVSEKVNGKWLEGLRISKEGVWAGASVAGASNGYLHVMYIENSKPLPVWVYARRDTQDHWSFISVDDTYIPYLPKDMAFGGRTSPGIKITDKQVYFLWRSGVETSPIILKTFDIATGKSDDPQILGRLDDAIFTASPSFVVSQFQTDSIRVLWTQSGKPIIYSR
jgi:hypothetical protein